MSSVTETPSVPAAAAPGTASNAAIDRRREAATPRGIGIGFPVYAGARENAELWDVEGRRYIDFAGGIAVLNTGHRHPKVDRGDPASSSSCFTHTAFQVDALRVLCRAGRAAERARAGHASRRRRVFFTTGAEAVENAIKIARAATGRRGVIAFTGGFHGRTLMTMALTGKVAPYKTGFGPFPRDIFHAPFPIALHGVRVEPIRCAPIERCSRPTSSRRASRPSSSSRCRAKAASTWRRPNSCARCASSATSTASC